MDAGLPLAIKSADRVLDLLELLASVQTGMSHAQIATALDIPKSSLTQLLKVVLTRSYLSFDNVSRTYTIGPMLPSLARQTMSRPGLAEITRPFLEELTRSTGESSALNVMDGAQIKVIATVSSPQRLVSHMRMGDLAPLYATSGGKMLLAFLDDRDLDRYFMTTELVAFGPNTIVSEAHLRKQLAQVRRDRIAYVFEEYTPGIVGMAVPVLRPDGTPVGAVNVALPAVRYGVEARAVIGGALRVCVEAVQQRLAQI